MATSITLTKITKDATTGRVTFQFGKYGVSFNSIADAAAFASALDARDGLIRLGIALCLRRQPTLNNPAALEGHSLTIDLTQTNWGTLG